VVVVTVMAKEYVLPSYSSGFVDAHYRWKNTVDPSFLCCCEWWSVVKDHC